MDNTLNVQQKIELMAHSINVVKLSGSAMTVDIVMEVYTKLKQKINE